MKKYDKRKIAENLADRPYEVHVLLNETTDGDPVYVATSPALEGCFGQGLSIEDAKKNLAEARIDFIQSLLEDNLPVPDPYSKTITSANFSVTLTLRYKQSDLSDPEYTYQPSQFIYSA